MLILPLALRILRPMVQLTFRPLCLIAIGQNTSLRQHRNPIIWSWKSRTDSLRSAHSYITRDAECQRYYIAVVIPSPILQAMSAAKSDRLTWFSGMRTLGGVTETEHCELQPFPPPYALALASRVHTAGARNSRHTQTPCFARSFPVFAGVCRIFSGSLQVHLQAQVVHTQLSPTRLS